MKQHILYINIYLKEHYICKEAGTAYSVQRLLVEWVVWGLNAGGVRFHASCRLALRPIQPLVQFVQSLL